MKSIGVVLEKTENGKYDVFIVKLGNSDVLDMELLPNGEGRTKASALKVAELGLLRISQQLQRGQVSFDSDDEETEDFDE